ncbi:MAG: FecR family protein [Myxococcota bacterium]
MTELDEGLRARLQDLDGDPAERDYSALANYMADHGPGIVRSAKRRQTAFRVTGVVAVCCGLVAVGVGLATNGPDAPVATETAQESSGPDVAPVESPHVPAEAPALAIVETPRPCEARTPSRRPARVSGTRVDLDYVAFESPSDSDLDLEVDGGCRTTLRLTSGTVLVHARDLGGGELSVHTPHARAVVTGTIFRVRTDEEGIEVEVLEGSVRVERDEQVLGNVGTGDRLRWSSIGSSGRASESVIESSAREETLAAVAAWDTADHAPESNTVALAPVSEALARTAREERVRDRVEETPLSDAELAAEAEAARASGNAALARRLYRRLGARRGATAEAAWIRLARMEMSRGNGRGALAALGERSRRFSRGSLAIEARWIEVQAHQATGSVARARRAAEDLVSRYPRTPQGQRAERWLEAHE